MNHHYADASEGHVLEEQLFFPSASGSQQTHRTHQTQQTHHSQHELHIAFGGYERCAPDFHIQRQRYPFHVIEYPLRGRCQLEINHQPHELSYGRLAGFAADSSHHYRVDATDPMEHYFICFTGTAANDVFNRCRLSAQPSIDLETTSDIHFLIPALIRSGRAGKDQMSNYYLRLLLLELSDESPIPSEDLGSASNYQHCCDFMNENFSWISRSQEIADSCNISTRHLSRLFQQHGSESPQAYLLRLKMNKASVLLLASQASIQSIASTVGYDDPYHFSRNFKKAFAVSPKIFRQQEHPS